MTSTPDGDAEYLLGQYEKADDLQAYSQKPPSLWKQAAPWVLAGIFGLLSGALLIREYSRDRLAGFDTELPAARKLIEFEKRQMKGSDDHLYVGKPSQDVDNAWIRLIYGLNVNLDANEIGKFADDTFSWPQDGKFFTGIQCQADLTPMLWHEKKLDNSSNTHMGTIQDRATTALYLDMETTYTCRKWEPIHEWASSRQVNYEERKDLVQGGGKIQILD
ncbi:hypothetical protein N7523_001723 [Penicillium sp. IBT 18751x]|nr:hypothetical protein N7523_001723 [Penicillium sp. IBT 18751x]